MRSATAPSAATVAPVLTNIKTLLPLVATPAAQDIPKKPLTAPPVTPPTPPRPYAASC